MLFRSAPMRACSARRSRPVRPSTMRSMAVVTRTSCPRAARSKSTACGLVLAMAWRFAMRSRSRSRRWMTRRSCSSILFEASFIPSPASGRGERRGGFGESRLRNLEKPPRIRIRKLGSHFNALAACRSHRCANVGQIHRLVTPMRRLRMQIARQQIRRIGLDHQPIVRNQLREVAQMLPAAFVANPTRDTDIKPTLDIGDELVALAGEAMHDRARNAIAHIVEAGDEIRMRIALMQEQWLAGFHADRELAFEGRDLRRVRRIVAVIIETGLADGAHFGVRRELAQ